MKRILVSGLAVALLSSCGGSSSGGGSKPGDDIPTDIELKVTKSEKLTEAQKANFLASSRYWELSNVPSILLTQNIFSTTGSAQAGSSTPSSGSAKSEKENLLSALKSDCQIKKGPQISVPSEPAVGQEYGGELTGSLSGENCPVTGTLGGRASFLFEVLDKSSKIFVMRLRADLNEAYIVTPKKIEPALGFTKGQSAGQISGKFVVLDQAMKGMFSIKGSRNLTLVDGGLVNMSTELKTVVNGSGNGKAPDLTMVFQSTFSAVDYKAEVAVKIRNINGKSDFKGYLNGEELSADEAVGILSMFGADPTGLSGRVTVK